MMIYLPSKELLEIVALSLCKKKSLVTFGKTNNMEQQEQQQPREKDNGKSFVMVYGVIQLALIHWWLIGAIKCNWFFIFLPAIIVALIIIFAFVQTGITSRRERKRLIRKLQEEEQEGKK